MSDQILSFLTVEGFRDILLAAGYRVESIADNQIGPMLRSATSGLAFDIQFVNPLPGDATAYTNLFLRTGFQVRGDLPLSVVNDWNNNMRFGRLRLSNNLLVVDMDISVLGGVTAAYLRNQVDIWDKLIQGLIVYLRDAIAKLPSVDAEVKSAA
jgi:hypothetical protein